MSYIGLIGNYGFIEPEPNKRWLSKHLGLQIMRGPAKPHNPLEKLYRFHKRKKRWIQIVGYKRMRQVCRKLKPKPYEKK